MFGAFLNPVTAVGGAEVEREYARCPRMLVWPETVRCGGSPPTSIQPLSPNLY